MRMGEPSTWLVLALSGVFLALGILFIAAPPLGAAVFGIPAVEAATLAYVDAIGFRDLAFGLYLFALARMSTRRVVGTVLGLTALIPIGDLVIVGVMRGLSAPGHLLLHAASFAVMAGASLWLLRHDPSNDRKDQRL
jgi:Domain of unknown function (DUF4267)